MKIEKNWFYIITKKDLTKQKNEIIVWDNITITLFCEETRNFDFVIWKDSFVELYFLFNWEKDNSDWIKINTLQEKSWSKLRFNLLILSKNNIENKIEAKSIINSNNVKTNTKILSIVSNDWFIDLDGIIKINKWLKDVKARLEEDNIFLWNSWKINWIPTLLVESNDVEASHSCKIEKISDEKLFYLRSRWIKKEDSISLMLKAKIIDLFKCISMLDNNFYEKLILNILKRL